MQPQTNRFSGGAWLLLCALGPGAVVGIAMSAVIDRTSSAGAVALAATAVAIPAGGPADLYDLTPAAARPPAAGATRGAAQAPRAEAPGAVPYPEGYRAWQHVKSEIVEKGHAMFPSVGGLHHIYANDLAMAGYRSGRFADGSVIVFDLLEVASVKLITSEGARKSVWVMHRDARQYAGTAGWGFELFTGDSKTARTLDAKGAAACAACHAKAPTEGVFSRYRP